MPSAQWDRDAARVEAFLEAAIALDVAYKRHRPQAGLTEGARIAVEIEQLSHDVATTSGPAGAVAQRLGQHITIATRVLNPIAAWEVFLPGDFVAHPDMLISFTEAVLSRCRAEFEDARARERGVVGLLARAVRFPTDVREAAGLKSKAGQRAAFAVAVAVEVVAALVVLGLTAWLGIRL